MFKEVEGDYEKMIKKNRNKKQAATVLMVAAVTAMSLAGCKKEPDNTIVIQEGETPAGCVPGCACTGCICCETLLAEKGSLPGVTDTESEQEEQNITESVPRQETSVAESSEPESATPESSTTMPSEEGPKEVSQLSEGEIAARKEQQANFVEARETLYSLPNSKEKTEKINQMDRQILANNTYDFSGRNAVFIGDSITEGIAGAVDAEGNFISYVNYADSALHFQRALNHGGGGRMFTPYADEALSLALNFGNITNNESDIIVVFAGVNDYLSTPENKRYGDINDTVSTAGYCGSVRYFMKQLKEYYGDKEVFFVTMYNIPKTVQCTYSDATEPLTLNDYLDVQRKLASEYGFHVIELHNIGFMDCSDPATANYYLADGLHPKDTGNIVLGEHIAAELSLYFGQK